MGYKKVADKPGPLKLLAILAAVQNGASTNSIAKKTKYSRSSITRWHLAFGHDAAWAAEVVMALPEKHRRLLLLESHISDRLALPSHSLELV